MADPADTNSLLQLWSRSGGAQATPCCGVSDELRGLAAAQLGREWSRRALQATELVHEAWFRLCGEARPSFDNRRHFFGCAARAMRQALIDRSRRRQAEKRGSGLERVQLDDLLDLPAVRMST